MKMEERRVVVTGVGVVSALGCGTEIVWSRLLDGQSGIGLIEESEYEYIHSKVAAKVPCINSDIHGFDLNKLMHPKNQKRMDRFIQLGMEAANQAIKHAGWFPKTEEEKERTATIVGSSLGGFSAMSNAVQAYGQKGASSFSPFTIPSMLSNLIAGNIAIQHGFKGASGSPTTACVASTQAIGDGMRMILCNEADVVICGGAESCINPIVMGNFVASKAVSTGFNSTPQSASRPFDKDRDGFVLGEGAAVLVLESAEHAERRGATPLAELVGYGTCTDAYHVTACLGDGNGLQRSMRAALKMSGITPKDVGYVNAHGTSTPLGDRSEITAIKEVFGSHGDVCVSSTKSATGHLLGAAGSIEAIFTILSLRDGIIPPTLNLDHPDDCAKDMDIIAHRSRAKTLDYALSNSAGFGGVNASLIFKKWPQYMQ